MHKNVQRKGNVARERRFVRRAPKILFFLKHLKTFFFILHCIRTFTFSKLTAVQSAISYCEFRFGKKGKERDMERKMLKQDKKLNIHMYTCVCLFMAQVGGKTEEYFFLFLKISSKHVDSFYFPLFTHKKSKKVLVYLYKCISIQYFFHAIQQNS